MNRYDLKDFPNVTVSGIDLSSLSEEAYSLLCVQAKYCQAMTDADIAALRSLAAEDMVFVHMSGRKQTREEYFADIAAGRLRYYSIGIENPVIHVQDGRGSITFTSVLNASAYGARGTFRMKGTHFYVRKYDSWLAVNGEKPETVSPRS